MFRVKTFPTSRLLYPVTKVLNVELVDTSSKYFVAPDDACQLAVNAVLVILVAANATGAVSPAAKVVSCITLLLGLVLDALLALTL